MLKMSVNNKKGPVFEAGLCRCCGVTKRCRLLNAEYQWLGHKEIYSDIFLDCFGLVLSHLDSEEQERLICATCVSRLREANSFRLQVLQCEERLLRASIQLHYEGGDESSNLKDESSVKQEKPEENVEEDIDNDDGMDHVDNGGDIASDLKDETSVKEEKPEENVKEAIGNDNGMDQVDNAVVIDGIKEGYIAESKSRRRKRKSSNVRSKRKKNLAKDNLAEKNRMLQDMEKTYDRLRDIQNVDTEQEPYYLCKPTKTKDKDNSDRSLHNINVLVENSYICPFDTSFSDYFCIYCRQKFTDPNKLRDHTLTHAPKDFCDVLKNNGFSKKLQIDIYRIDCRLCPESISDLEVFKQHIVLNHGKLIHSVPDEFLKFKLTTSNLSCLECDNTFGFFHALKKHMAKHFGSCICDVCGAHYFEERMLLLHQKTHQRVEESYSCKDCGKTFKSKYTRYIHIARTHKKEAAYQCNKCDEVFFSYMTRYRHMMDAHGEERTFQCEHCDRAYDSRKSLREHNRRLHLKIMKHQCDLCDKKFYLPCRLREHMSSHTGERNFRCDYCGKTFPRLRGLKVHMQSHSNEKKYKCVMCNASFTQNVNLKNHMKRQHQSLEMDESFHE